VDVYEILQIATSCRIDLDMDNLPQVENVFSSSTEKIIILDKNNKTDPFGIMWRVASVMKSCYCSNK
jgi:hypothetical protein